MDPAKEAQMNGMLFHLASQLEGGAIEVFFVLVHYYSLILMFILS